MNGAAPSHSVTSSGGDRSAARSCRVLVPLATPYLYGLERAVIETFDALRPTIEATFVQSEAIVAGRPPIVEELERRRLPMSLLPDGRGWPRLGRPGSIAQLAGMSRAFFRGNAYYARAARDCDALYVTGGYSALFTVVAALRCRRAGKRVVHHFHEWPVKPLPAWWRALATDYVHNTASGRDRAVALDGALRGRRHWVTPCVIDADVTVAPPSPIERDGRQHLVFAGQVALHKGIDLLIEAFGRIAPRHPNAVLHLVGGCAESFLPALRELCDRSGAAERIKYWGYRTDALSFFRDAYLCVQSTPPSRCLESLGRTAIEAMALGVPTVCFGSGGLAEVVLHGQTGLVCDEDAGALARGIERFLDDPAFRASCGSNAVQRYGEHYSRETVLPRWLGVFGVTDSRAASRSVAPSPAAIS